MKHYLSICAIFRNEASYMKEWIEFHRLMSVDHFYLYNNLSEDDYLDLLQPYIDQGIVTLHEWPRPWKRSVQADAYQDCLDQYKDESQWIAFIDLDEFLFAPNAPKLADVLQDFECFPGIVVNWQIYGSSGHTRRPEGLVIENFIKKARADWIRNRRIKSIVNPRKALRPNGAHIFEYIGSEPAVTENFEPVRIITHPNVLRKLRKRLARTMGLIPRIPIDPYADNLSSIKAISVNKLRINHYVVKSREEAMREIENHGNLKSKYRLSWLEYHDRNEECDAILQKYAPFLKAAFSSTDSVDLRRSQTGNSISQETTKCAKQ